MKDHFFILTHWEYEAREHERRAQFSSFFGAEVTRAEADLAKIIRKKMQCYRSCYQI